MISNCLTDCVDPQAELCMHHYVDFLELIDQHVVGKNAEKVENNKPEDSDAMQIGHNEDMTVNDNVLNNCAIKKAVIDVSADECSRKRRKEIIILAQVWFSFESYNNCDNETLQA